MNLKSSASEFVDLLDNRRRHLQSRAARRLWRLRRDTTVRSVDARAATLERLDRWTEPLAERPVLDRVARWVDAGVERIARPSLADYDDLTVKEIGARIRDLDDVAELHRIARYEAAHKARKTVARDIDKRLSQLEPDVVPWKAWSLDLTRSDDASGVAA